MINRSDKISFSFALGLHLLLIGLLIFTFERTIVIPAQFPEEQKEIINAVMVNDKSLQKEISRLEAIETKKLEQEQARQQALLQKQEETKQKIAKEEALAQTLQKKNEQLKKEAEQQAQVREKELKAQQEELKKIKKEKEEALALKKKALEAQKAAQAKKVEEAKKAEEKKAAELAKQNEEMARQQQANIRVKQDQITHYAMLMRNKIHQNWRQPIGLDIAGFTCKVQVRLLPTGDVIDAAVVESSGSLEFDRSTEVAIRKASPLPMPEDPSIAQEFRQFTFTFHPEAA